MISQDVFYFLISLSVFLTFWLILRRSQYAATLSQVGVALTAVALITLPNELKGFGLLLSTLVIQNSFLLKRE